MKKIFLALKKNSMNKSVFKKQHYVEINVRREAWLSRLLNPIIESINVKRAVDVGCGQGYFTHLLHQFGLDVTGIDGRNMNVEVAKSKYPMVRFLTGNIEHTETCGMGTFDLVLCLGLLYHLENPFCAIRNLFGLTKQILIIETRVVPSRWSISVLFEEVSSDDQGLDFIAFIVSQKCLVEMLYKAGFKYVYLTKDLPDHYEFRKSFSRKQARTCIVASKSALNLQQLELLPNMSCAKDWWHPWWFNILQSRKTKILRMLQLFSK